MAGDLDPLPELLEPPEAARILKVKTSWIYDAVRRNRIPHVRIGRHVRFIPADLADWITKQRQ